MKARNRSGPASRLGFVVCGGLSIGLMIFVFVLTQRLDRELFAYSRPGSGSVRSGVGYE